ncbi:alkaline phosphatase D [Duganella sp. SG902]|uniref:alkaline phosphatase D family protein n=1 Tax=Duganella sp. SG902 TaxID=2587016 RepID=UPI00159DD560|nr:alkaline phosphatase D family protein [Duganella sp. SG902]NVM80162.1 alkaline phosphatase D [Duganella sp. SG902]
MDDQRRIFLATASRLGALAALTSASATGRAQNRDGGHAYPFSLGVASGSPLPDAVIIWTRILHDPLNAAATPRLAFSVRWEMAEDEQFRRIVAKGAASAAPELAHSVHVDVTGLRPDRWYWYRFMLGDAVSPVGRTRTVPAASGMPKQLKLAVASCQHWEFGTYAAHRHIAAAAPDLVAFLGDYIYEWGPYQLRHPKSAVRASESFTLADYRARYAQYKTDANLQAAHHAAPWIVTWDDHEVANDYGNEQDERLDPRFLQRRAAAYQAFYEHMPLRLTPRDFAHLRIYQRYDWGKLARFHVLDDRQYRADLACPPPGRGGSNSVQPRTCPALTDLGRGMLGREQEQWLAQGLSSSPARWNILAQQTLMAQNSQLPVVKEGDGRFWTDGWDGYPAARRKLMDTLHTSRASNPLVLSGDVHSFFACELARNPSRPASPDNPLLATEFCGTSITSPSRPQTRTEQYVSMNHGIKYGRSDKRGYMLLTITPSDTSAHFLVLDNVHDDASPIARAAAFVVRDGRAGPVRA